MATDEDSAEQPQKAPGAADYVQQALRADLNHKLRTPLNAIIGFAELLVLQPAGKRSDVDVRQILKSARELLAIIDI